ncbi:MAG: type II toxin-antitoxin system RelE/ParE family toxin [Alphaproteobacteria bacterium]|nr:type II toxin-antitoxin system RelE/ParE family toxin [Alphaproteobacteria bacterium]
MLELRYFEDDEGRRPFEAWFEAIDDPARAKVAVGLKRMALGNLSNVKSVGAGVLEFRIDFGPGYRVYFGRDGDTVVILLTGGTKKRQQRDIARAHAFWTDYKRRKRGAARSR